MLPRHVFFGRSFRFTRSQGCFAVLAAATMLGSAASGGIRFAAAPDFRPADGENFPVENARTNNAGISVGNAYANFYPDPSPIPIVWGRAQRWTVDGSIAFSMSELGPSPDGHDQQRVSSINDAGISAGYSTKYSAAGINLGLRAVRWDASGHPTELGTLGTSASGYASASVEAINLAGTAVGRATDYLSGTGNAFHAVRWEAGSTIAVRLDGLTDANDGQNYVTALDVNDAGVAVGYGGAYVGGQYKGDRPLRWDAGVTTPVVLGALPGYSPDSSTSAKKINRTGIVIGSASLDRPAGATTGLRGLRGIRWDAGGNPTELLGYDASASGNMSSSALDINDEGVVVGRASRMTSGGGAIGTRPTYWNANSGLPNELPGHLTAAGTGETGEALSINNLGVIVGKLSNSAYSFNGAMLWLPGEQLAIQLATLLPAGSGWKLGTATHITDTGFIEGSGTYDPNPAVSGDSYDRLYSMLVPRAGTYGMGDANFDAQINFDDLLILSQHYGQANPDLDIHVGDTDLSGQVDFGDLLALAQHYQGPAIMGGGTFDAAFASEWSLAQAIAPEPCGVAMAGAMMTIVGRSRRKRGA